MIPPPKIALLFGSGLRIAEALALRPRDVDLDDCSLRVQNGNGGRARVSGITAGMAAIVAEWVTYRRDDLSLGPSKPLFCQISRGKVGRPISQACVRQMLRRRVARAGIEKRVHAHGFRHSHAAKMAAAGVPLNLVQRQLGHRNVATTSRYIDHIAPADVVKAVRELG